MQRVTRHRLAVRSRTVTEDDADFPTMAVKLRSKPMKGSDDDPDGDEDESEGAPGKSSSRAAKPTSTRRRKSNENKRPSSSFIYAGAGTPFTASAIGSTSNLLEEAAQTSGTIPIVDSSPSPMSRGALTGIIVGATALVLALLLSAGIIWYRRRRRTRTTVEELSRIGPGRNIFESGAESVKLSGSEGARLSKIEDEDPFLNGEKGSITTLSSLTSLSKLEKASDLDVDKADPTAVRTPVLPSAPSEKSEKVLLTPSHPDYIPTRPPRPTEQYLFESSPVKPIQHNPPNMTPKHASKASEAGLSTYQRNLMALTSSMAFDSPPVLQSTFRTIPRPEDSPFTDLHAVKSLSRKPSLPRNMKKDTIVVSYASNIVIHTADRILSLSTGPGICGELWRSL